MFENIAAADEPSGRRRDLACLEDDVLACKALVDRATQFPSTVTRMAEINCRTACPSKTRRTYGEHTKCMNALSGRFEVDSKGKEYV